MPCPICDQKPINCDCTEAERRQYAEIAELEEQVARLRLTDEEREAVECGIQAIGLAPRDDRTLAYADMLRGLLERTSAR